MTKTSLKIPFDSSHNPITPTVVLTNRDGNKLGIISKAYSFHVMDGMAETPTLSFKVTKKDNDEILSIWDEITNLKLIWCVEWDYWFEIRVELEDTNETIKSIDATALAQAELSQTNIYDTQINTEDDIAREAYDLPTTIYNKDRPDASLLHRMLDKNPNYSVKYVDDTLKKIQRVFEFNGNSVKDCFNEVEQEIGALFTYGNNSAEELDPDWGKVPERTISLYDMESNCVKCGFRGEFEDVCPKCGSNLITGGYGEDTTIFVSKDNLTDDVTFSTDVDSVKNCFRLVGGDDLMTATIRNCNPNGSNYIWFIPELMKHDMPTELVEKLEDYDEQYIYYQNTYQLNISEELINRYNDLIEKYSGYNEELKPFKYPMIGYTSLSHAFYDIIDFSLYLEHSLMPIPQMSETNATLEAGKLTSGELSPCAVSKTSTISKATAELNVLAMAKVLVRSTYSVEIHTTDYNEDSHTWTGYFTVTNYSDSEDTADSKSATVFINEDYERFVKQKLDKALKDFDKDEEYGIVALFKKEPDEFSKELVKYGLVSLETFYRCCQGCLDVLTEYGAGNKSTFLETEFSDVYDKFYGNYLNKLSLIEKEIKLRESETGTIQEFNDALTAEREKIQGELSLENYLGDKYWKLFCSYRREDQYENSNYISDGLSNSDLFRRADEFIESAQKDLFKSATMQHHITATLKNLLVIKEFEKLLDYFEVGNWMRIECDGVVYKLRMIRYEIDFDDLEYIDVEFSDVINTLDGRSDIWSILSRADSVASSYDSYRKRSEKGADASNQMTNWFKYGLDTTLTKIVKNADNQDILWDEHGLLFREKDYVTGDFLPEQMKIINKTIAITSDAWKTLKTAIGNFYYVNPKTKELENGYGINGEVVIGKLILGEGLGIYNPSGSLTFDEDGFQVTNGTERNTFIVNPNSDKLIELKNSGEDILWVDAAGTLHISGDGAGLDISTNSSVTDLKTQFEINENGIQAEMERALGVEEILRASIKANADSITSEIERAKKYESTLDGKITSTSETLRSEITQTAEEITSTVEKTVEEFQGEISTNLESAKSEFKQRADKIELSVETETKRAQGVEQGLDGKITETNESLSSKIEQTAGKIESTVKAEQTRAEKAEGELQGKITSTTEDLQTQITQTAESITSTVKENIKEVQDGLTTKLDTAMSEINQKADAIELSVQTEQTRAEKAEGDEAARAQGVEESLKSEIELLPGKLRLSVSGKLGDSKASITLQADGSDVSKAEMDLGSVRQRFADDGSSITIEAGKVTFGAGTFVVNATNFQVTADGTVTAKAGEIGGCKIVEGKLQVPCAQITNLTVDSADITGTLSANQINVSKLSSITADLGTITAGKIHSSTYNYTSGNFSSSGMELDFSGNGYIRSKNFAIDTNGNAYFNGKLDGASGNFSGKITSDHPTNFTKTVIDGGTVSFYFNDNILGSIMPYYFSSGSTITGWGIDFNLFSSLKAFRINFSSGSAGSGELIFNSGAYSIYHNGLISIIDTYFKNKVVINNSQGLCFESGAYIESPSAQHLYFHASTESNYTLFFGTTGGVWTLCPNSSNQLRLGCEQCRWYGIFLNSSPNVTSDRNKKNSITTLLSSKYESLFFKLKPVSYKLNTGDRIHTGFISQDIEEAMDEVGLTAMDWGAFCRDLKEGSENEYNYSFRYEEVIPLNTHMIQRTMLRVDDNTNMIQKTITRVNNNTDAIQKVIVNIDDNAVKIEKLTKELQELRAKISALESAA